MRVGAEVKLGGTGLALELSCKRTKLSMLFNLTMRNSTTLEPALQPIAIFDSIYTTAAIRAPCRFGLDRTRS